MVNKETQEQEIVQFFTRNRLIEPGQVANSDFQARLKEQISREYLIFQEISAMEDPSQVETTTQPALPFYKRKPLLLVGGLFALAFFILLMAVMFMGPSLRNNKLRGELASHEGFVFYKNKGGQWMEAAVNQLIEEGMTFKVEGNGRAVINLDDGSAIRLSDSSIVNFLSLDPNDIRISNEAGEVYTRVMSGTDKKFSVVVGDHTYEALGTAFKTLCYDDVKGVEVYESQVKIIGLNENNELIVEQGNKYYVINLNDPNLASVLLEIDPELLKEDSFVMWNKDLDENITEFKNKMGILFDIKAPFLFIASPENGEDTHSESITVSGSSEVSAKIFINETEVDNINGSFTFEVNLVLGLNEIRIKAVDSSGNYVVKTLQITYELEEEYEDENEVETTPTKSPTTTVKPTNTTPMIKLWSEPDDDAVKLKWQIYNLDAPYGFKIVRSANANPVYPGNDYQYLNNSGAREYEWKMSNGLTYHFRVCRYNGNGSCGQYSNDITVTAPMLTPTPPVEPEIDISLTPGPGVNQVQWTYTGSVTGFKVVWSKSPNPTYGSSAHAQYSGSSPSGELEAYDGLGTYYVRVCAYVGGEIGCWPNSYSNQVTINFVAPTPI